MPYEISFVKAVTPEDPSDYFNECCYGGDVVSDRLRPAIQRRYTDIQANQEDWGWFLWFRDGDAHLAVDIFCDDPKTGAFRIHLTSSKRRWFTSKVVDLPQLEELKQLVASELAAWTGEPVRTERLDENRM